VIFLQRIDVATFRNISTKSLDINTLKRISAILGCLLFVISFVSPFYLTKFYSVAPSRCWAYFWSYKYNLDGLYPSSPFNKSFLVYHSNEYWFPDYWFSGHSYSPVIVDGVVPTVPQIPLLSMFTIQALTLIFGAVSIIFNRRTLSFAPVLLSLLAMALMVNIGIMLSGYPKEIYSGEYQLGFYLVFPSLFLFFSAFVLNELMKREKTRSKRDTAAPAQSDTMT
jgi:hypothetical protein